MGVTEISLHFRKARGGYARVKRRDASDAIARETEREREKERERERAAWV
jgi:hypothetical protein